MSITFNPFKNFGNSPGFNVSSQGYVQGDAQDDPALQLLLESGFIADSAASQIFGGMPITVSAAVRGNQNTYGGSVVKPLVVNHIGGWCVMNRNYNGIITAGNPVPSWGAGESVHFYRPGSGARIPLPLASDVIAYVNAGTYPQVWYWDSVNHLVTSVEPSDSSAAVPITLVDVNTSGTTITATGSPVVIQWAYGMPIGLFIV